MRIAGPMCIKHLAHLLSWYHPWLALFLAALQTVDGGSHFRSRFPPFSIAFPLPPSQAPPVIYPLGLHRVALTVPTCVPSPRPTLHFPSETLKAWHSERTCSRFPRVPGKEGMGTRASVSWLGLFIFHDAQLSLAALSFPTFYNQPAYTQRSSQPF